MSKEIEEFEFINVSDNLKRSAWYLTQELYKIQLEQGKSKEESIKSSVSGIVKILRELN